MIKMEWEEVQSSFADWHFWISIAWQLFFVWLVGYGVNVVLDERWLSYSLGLLGILLAVGYTPWANWWFAKPKQNHIAVYAYPFRKRKKPESDKDIVEVKPSRTMRAAIGPALTGINPLMSLVGGKVINTARSTPLSKKTPLMTLDNVPLTGDWLMPVTAIADEEGAICLSQQNAVVLERVLTQKSESFLQETTRKMKLEEVFEGLYAENGGIKIRAATAGTTTVKTTNSVESAYNQMYGGKGTITLAERQMGVFTGDPQVTIELDAEILAAMRARAVAHQSALAIKIYVDEAKIDEKTAANMEAANRGKPQPRVLYDFTGLKPGNHVLLGDIQGRK